MRWLTASVPHPKRRQAALQTAKRKSLRTSLGIEHATPQSFRPQQRQHLGRLRSAPGDQGYTVTCLMDVRVRKTVELMRANLDKELRLTAIAQSVNLSVWRLCHIFRSDLGISPIHYLRSLRMERAKDLLETSFLSVKEIAHRVGLNDESHFVRDFKVIYGLTPISYRNSFLHGSTDETDPIAKSANE